jgi:hypothetical protein
MSYDRTCGAKTRSGGQCGRPAGWGTDHVGYGRCKLHGGCVPSGRKAAQRQMAADQVATYGLPREVDPHQALLEELHRTAGHVAYLGTIVAELDQDGLKQYASAGSFRSVADGVERALVWEKPSVWLDLYERERKHLAAVAKTCVDVGIEERRIRLVEHQGELLAQVIRGIAADMGISDDPRLPTVVRRHLTLVAGEQAA